MIQALETLKMKAKIENNVIQLIFIIKNKSSYA